LASGKGPGWRAAQKGKQIIRIIFDKPRPLHRIRLEFAEIERRVKRRIRGGSHSGTCEILAVSGPMGTREAGAKGGHARAAKMTAKERSEAAKKAARARWAKAKKRRPK
jgi:hypothetical protein